MHTCNLIGVVGNEIYLVSYPSKIFKNGFGDFSSVIAYYGFKITFKGV